MVRKEMVDKWIRESFGLRHIVESKELVKQVFLLFDGFDGVALCGGLAVALWVRNRIPTSREVDLLVAVDEVEEVRGVFEEVGAEVGGMGEGLGLESIYVKWKGWEMDLIVAKRDWEEDAIVYSHVVRLDGVKVRVVRPEWLIVMKLVSMRDRDVQDIVMLSRIVDVKKVERLVGMYLGKDYVEEFAALVEIGRGVSRFEAGRWA